jgi:hypothetical protein
MGIYTPSETERLAFDFRYVKPYTYQYYKPQVKKCTFTDYNNYKSINSCELYLGQQHQHKTLYDVLRNFFEFNSCEKSSYNIERIRNINLPLYYLKQDNTKQLLSNLKFEDFSYDPETRLTLPDRILYGSVYIDEFNYYRFANMLNFKLIFANSGFDYLYRPDKEHELIRVNGPRLTEMICFV